VFGPTVAIPASELADTLQRRYGLAGRRRPTELLHISLLRVGGYQSLRSDILDAALRGARLVDVPKFDITFDRAMNFNVGNGRHALVLRGDSGTTEVATLREAIVAAMEAVGLSVPPLSGFAPHMTLLYGREPFPEMTLDQPITLPASDFTLVHSLYGRSLYQFLGRWPLRG
jgi:2'-5' RNA ligase